MDSVLTCMQERQRSLGDRRFFFAYVIVATPTIDGHSVSRRVLNSKGKNKAGLACAAFQSRDRSLLYTERFRKIGLRDSVLNSV